MTSSAAFTKARSKYELIDYAEKHFSLFMDGPNRYRIVCPWHGDTDPSLVLYPKTQSFYCFGCQKAGDVLDLVAKVEGVPLSELLDPDTSEADYELWKSQLGEDTFLTLDDWYLIGCIALRSLQTDPNWETLAHSLDEATLDDPAQVERIAKDLVSKANAATSVYLDREE